MPTLNTHIRTQMRAYDAHLITGYTVTVESLPWKMYRAKQIKIKNFEREKGFSEIKKLLNALLFAVSLT